MFPIIIATKGRAGSANTIALLLAENIVPTLVVEPQDAAAYEAAYPSCPRLILPENDKGVSLARKAVQVHARAAGFDWYWMMDDDIKQFYMVREGKCVKTSACEALDYAEQIIINTPEAAIGALEYQQYAWSAKKARAMNSYCDVAVLVNVGKTRLINYRDNCKEDRDFVLQILSNGFQAVRSTWTAFAAPRNGSNKGGLHEAYKGGLESHWSRRMVELWPGVCELNTKPDGRPDVKIHWKHFKRK